MATTGMGPTKPSKTTYRLSPNEEAALIKQEKDRRRKLRIQQVRDQERSFASKIRSNVTRKRGEELRSLAAHLRHDWEHEKKEKMEAFQKMFERSLGSVGDGHRAAKSQPPLTEIRAAQSVKDQHAANQRYNTALKKHERDTDQQYQKENAHIMARKSAIQTEKARAARIASLPPPKKDPIDELDDGGKENQVVTVISGFSTSHYHLKGEYVERAEPHEQEDARAAAQEAERRAREETAELEREGQERQTKAQLRHDHARKQELLQRDYHKLLGELGQMEQADRRRRQAIVANIPHQVFQPPHKRLEDKHEEQQKLEQAFEDMYMANTDYTGDLVLALEPKPKGDADLDVTLDSVSDDVGISLQPVPMPPPHMDAATTRLPEGLDEEEEEADADTTIVDETQRQPRAPLKALMDRIRTQREQLKKKVILEIPSRDTHPGEESETPSSSRDVVPDQGSSSPSPKSSRDASESDGSTVDTLETGTLSGDGNKQEEKMTAEDGGSGMTLLHPLEEAAKIRSTSKLPDVQQQKQELREIMSKEDGQRLRLAEQQLQDHLQHRDHLQTLQDNLLQRQRMLQQKIQEQERRHWEQQQQQQELGQQQAGPWSNSVTSKQQMPTQPDTQPREPNQFQELGLQQGDVQQLPENQEQQLPKEAEHPIQRLIKQLQVSDQQRQQQRQQRETLMTQQPGRQPELTQYMDLPDHLLQKQMVTHQQLTNQLEQPQQQLQQPLVDQQPQIPSAAADFQLPRRSQPNEKEDPTLDLPVKPFNHIEEAVNIQSVQPGSSQTGEKPAADYKYQPPTEGDPGLIPTKPDSSDYQIPVKIYQGHSHEFLKRYGSQEGTSTAKEDRLISDQDSGRLPSPFSLQEAQMRLQRRRERLMRLYPELELPPYEPYLEDADSPTSTRSPTYKPSHPGGHLAMDAKLRNYEEESLQAGRDEMWILPSLRFGSDAPPGLAAGAPPMPGSEEPGRTSGIPAKGTGVSGVSDLAQPSVSGMTSAVSGTGVTASEPGLTGPTASIQTSGLAATEDGVSTIRPGVALASARSPGTEGAPLNEMERQLEQHRQQLLKTRQQLQQQQQQQQLRILDKQRVLSQRIEEQRQEQLARRHAVMSEGQPQATMMSQPGTQAVMTSWASPQDLIVSQSGLMTSETHEVMTSASGGRPPKVSEEHLVILEAKAETISDSGAEETSGEDKYVQSMYKLPTMTFGQPNLKFDLAGDSQRSDDDPSLFHTLSPDSSNNLSENADHHLMEVARSATAESAFSSSESGGIRLLSQPLQYDWKTILASTFDNPDRAVPGQSTLPPMRVHTRPPPAPLRLPLPVEEAAPHELSTIVEMESLVAERGHAEVRPFSSTPHKSSPPQNDSEPESHHFSIQDYLHPQSEAGGMAFTMASSTDEVSGRYFPKTPTDVVTVEKLTAGISQERGSSHPNMQDHYETDASTSISIPNFSADVGRGVLSHPSSKLLSTGPTASVTKTPSMSTYALSTSLAPSTSPAVIHVPSPSTDNEGVSSHHPDMSSVSTLSEHDLPQTQHSLSSGESVERFLALASNNDSTTSDSVSSSSTQYQLQILKSDRRSSKSPIIKDFVTGIPSGSPWQPSSQLSSLPSMVVFEGPVPVTTAAPRQGMASTEYHLGLVSPQSTLTDTDSKIGSYLDSGLPVLPVFTRQDLPKDGIPMFSDVSLSHYNTSFESGTSILPASTVGPAATPSHQLPQETVEEFHRGASPAGESEQWFIPQQRLDASGLLQPTRGATVEPSSVRIAPEGVNPPENDGDDFDSRQGREDQGGTDDESSKLSYAGVPAKESIDATDTSDDTLQEAMRNIVLSESETSKETGILEDSDLTLISLNTTLTSADGHDDASSDTEKQGRWDSEELGSDSLLSFLHHEEELSVESPARSGSDQSKLAGTSPLGEKPVTPTAGTARDQPVSLQEAFERHKQAFVRSSRSRQLEVKVHAQTQQATAFSQTLDNWKRSRGGKVRRPDKSRTAKSSSKAPRVNGQRSAVAGSSSQGPTGSSVGETARTKGRTGRSTTKTASGREAAERDMYQRNIKLYNQLEEVRTKKVSQDRQKDYAANRQRRKEFEQKLQARLSKLSKQTTKPAS